MKAKTLLSHVGFISLCGAATLPRRQEQRQTVEWGACPDRFNISTVPIECGNLTVPLDYTEPDSDATLDLNLLKVPASREPKMGNILFNFGGPGVGCRPRMSQLSETLQVITGGHYDLITWDPRGTEDTLTFSCFDTAEERFLHGTINQAGGVGNTSDVALMGRQWTVSTILANTCANRTEAAERGSLVGNAFTARDGMQIVDALEEDGLLRFWGFSYGTVLGATLAAMFPDRVDKVVVDAVLNPAEYHGFDVELWADTDLVFNKFFEECLKAPEACELARTHNGSTVHELEEEAYHILDELKYRPVPWREGLMDSATVKGAIRPSLYAPRNWPALGSFMDALFARDWERFTVEFDNMMGLAPDVLSSGTGNDAPYAIHCGDKQFRFDRVEETLPIVDELGATSRLFGDLGGIFPMACSQWPFKAKETWTGPYTGIRTRKPLLIIGGTYDSATPFRSAQNMSAGFEESVLLRHDGFGHGSNNNPSLCTARAVQSFFMNGTLPAPGTVCPVEAPPFGDTTWTRHLPSLL